MEQGALNDHLLLLRLLSKNTNMLKADDLLSQVESVVCKQFFDPTQGNQISLDLVSLYAFEFSKVPFEFAEFHQSYFNYIKTNRNVIAQ